jgi:hypothetical protein
MSQCKFVVDDKATVQGTTLFAEGKHACIKETGVYFPPNHQDKSDELNVILWIHGYYVTSVKNIFSPSSDYENTLRQSVLAAQKDVALIAPWLGYKDLKRGSIGLGALGEGKGCQLYLEAVLTALGDLLGIKNLRLGTLIIAGHSAGGLMMRDAVKTLGGLQPSLKECWGFDCIYGPASTWSEWIRTNKTKVKLYFYIANGSNSISAVDLIKRVNGTLKKPAFDHDHRNIFMTPALKAHGTLIDRIAFQSNEEIQIKFATDAYELMRKEVDPLLDDPRSSKYWQKIYPHLKGHFEVVRDLLAPRIQQSSAL